MRATFRLGVILIAIALAFQAMAAEWPQFLGPTANGFAPDTGINKDWAAKAPKELWKVNLTDGGYAGPSVAAGKVFIIDHKDAQDIVRALNFANGEEIWRRAYDDVANANYGFARSTPVYENGKLYVIGRKGQLLCLNAENGEVIWQNNFITDYNGKLPGWDIAISPKLDGDKLIVCPGGKDAAVVALNKADGKMIWKGGGSDKPGYATPVIATIEGKKQYVIFTFANLIGVDAENGALLWSAPWVTGCEVNAATPIVIGNTVFITSNYDHGCALVEIKDGKAAIKWENKSIISHFNTPLLYEGNIYCTSNPSRLVCLDPATGTEFWRKPGFEKGGLVGVDGVMLVVDGGNGDVAMVELNKAQYKELGRFKPLGGRSWSPPVVSDSKLVIRNTTALACYDLK